MGLISPGSGVRAPPGAWSYSVMVITKDSDSFNPGSSPGRTFHFFFFMKLFFLNLSSRRDGSRPYRVHSSAVERRIADPEVAGSIPAAPFLSFVFKNIEVAKLPPVRAVRCFRNHGALV